MKRNRKERRRQVRTFSREDEENKTIEDTKDNAGRVAKIGHKSSECRWGVDNVDDDDDDLDGYGSGRRGGDQSESGKGSGCWWSMDRWDRGGDRRRRSE